MIPFKNFLVENAPFHRVGKIKAYFTDHSLQRKVERGNYMDISDFKKIIEEIVNNHILKNPKLFHENQELFAFSRSNNIGIVFAYRKDRFDTSNKRKHIYIMTILPSGIKDPRPGTPRIIVENTSELSDVFCNFVNNLNINLNEENQYELTIIKLTEHFSLFFVNGKLHSSNLQILELDN